MFIIQVLYIICLGLWTMVQVETMVLPSGEPWTGRLTVNPGGGDYSVGVAFSPCGVNWTGAISSHFNRRDANTGGKRIYVADGFD